MFLQSDFHSAEAHLRHPLAYSSDRLYPKRGGGWGVPSPLVGRPCAAASRGSRRSWTCSRGPTDGPRRAPTPLLPRGRVPHRGASLRGCQTVAVFVPVAEAGPQALHPPPGVHPLHKGGVPPWPVVHVAPRTLRLCVAKTGTLSPESVPGLCWIRTHSPSVMGAIAYHSPVPRSASMLPSRENSSRSLTRSPGNVDVGRLGLG